ncbi:diguanylate cyclase domain-containing protein [Spirulina sp. 06S082]|uniref:diguanylate cyclase domain-containing protein n=1 Tax=Spirulina sp. 06S082 TaxID=3110248 RepID=UPI002B20482B|nr:diguanylate cyclase [Spirulina sp. 06S082]MEA5469443.1 diguanylate cyclase [Spirulina sp. 06S082]
MFLQDFITSSDRTEDLKKAVCLLQATIDLTEDGIFAVDSTGKNMIFNQKLIEMWEISKKNLENGEEVNPINLIGKKVKNSKFWFNCLRNALNNPQSTSIDTFYLKNGKIFKTSSQPLYLDNEIVGRTWKFRDITEEEIAQINSKQKRLISQISQRIRESLKLDDILTITANEVRNFLQTDRVVLYEIKSDGRGKIAVESVGLGWRSILGADIYDPCFGEKYIQVYRQGRTSSIDDIYTAKIQPCHAELLQQFQVRSNLVVPILQGDKLWGLLIAHHCRDRRNWKLLEIELLQDLSVHVAIAIQQAILFAKLEKTNQELERIAAIDELTQIANRRKLEHYLHQQWHYAKEKKLYLSLILCDVDYFKYYNDTYGHQAGDDCLQQVAQFLAEIARNTDALVARYGGEEFALVLPNIAAKEAIKIAEDIRKGLAELKLVHARSSVSEYVTMSMGVFCLIPTETMLESELVARADEALYQAKQKGRDRAVLWQK